MRKSLAASAFLVLALAFAPPARAASSAWEEGEGASVRLVTAGISGGEARGILDVVLKPGWKTYWRDPGAAGVPPTIDVSQSDNVANAKLQFPAPERHDDGAGAWAGYDASVALPVIFQLGDPKKPARIEADVFLGICKDICIPFPAHFSVILDARNDADDAAAVDAAFAALPKPADARFGVVHAGFADKALTLDARLPDAAAETPALFLAGPEGFAFGVPAASRVEGAWRFVATVLDRPPGSEGAPIAYTLTAGKESVSGTFAMP